MGPTAAVGDDSLTRATTSQGDVDITKIELEQLNDVGTVTFTVGQLDHTDMRWEWSATLDTNAGDLPQLGVGIANMTNTTVANTITGMALGPHRKTLISTVDTHGTQNGTSVAMGSNFALPFNGQRTDYMSYEATDLMVKTALESRSTIGSVELTCAGPDETNGVRHS